MLCRWLANDIREGFLQYLRTRHARGYVLYRIHAAKGVERSTFQRQVVDVFEFTLEFLSRQIDPCRFPAAIGPVDLPECFLDGDFPGTRTTLFSLLLDQM